MGEPQPLLELGDLLQPHRWAFLPQATEEQLCEAVLKIAAWPEGQVLFTQLIVTYLLSHPQNMREVGKQDLVRELLDLMQRGYVRRQYAGVEKTSVTDVRTW